MDSIYLCWADRSNQWDFRNGRQSRDYLRSPRQVELFPLILGHIVDDLPTVPTCGPSFRHLVSSEKVQLHCCQLIVSSGADDDGSGSVTILESYRALLASDFRPVRPVEFHWYSAEVCRLNLKPEFNCQYVCDNRRKVAFSDLRLSPKPMNSVRLRCTQ